jgi:DNA-binding transcriptional regulator GbsR (MarR family)
VAAEAATGANEAAAVRGAARGPAGGRDPGARRDPGGGRDLAAVLRFVDRFASLLCQAGFARMPARVFVALLVTDSGGLTAAELVGMLQVSPAAISGAVGYLAQLGLVVREREAGSRRDRYQVPDDVWYEVVRVRQQVTARWVPTLQDGIETLGAGTPAGERLAETADFFEFLAKQGPEMLAKWNEHRAAQPR